VSGKKFDNGKPDLSLCPSIALKEMAFALMLGEQKYGRYNYCGGLEASRLIGAALRHLTAWNDGEDNDPESGHSHLGNALACIAMILRTAELGTLKDNRFQNRIVPVSLCAPTPFQKEVNNG
jgi:hypothetical protein